MNITIKLTKQEVKGIKEYLKACDDIENPNKHDIEMFIRSLVGIIHSPQEAVSEYIKAEIEP